MVFTKMKNGRAFIVIMGQWSNKNGAMFINGRMERSTRVILLMMPEPENVRLLENLGDYYTGDIVNGVQEGKGFFKWNDGTTYAGDWVNGYLHGYRYLSNVRMVMFIRVSLPISNGWYGIYTYSDGYVEEGYWLNGEPI